MPTVFVYLYSSFYSEYIGYTFRVLEILLLTDAHPCKTEAVICDRYPSLNNSSISVLPNTVIQWFVGLSEQDVYNITKHIFMILMQIKE